MPLPPFLSRAYGWLRTQVRACRDEARAEWAEADFRKEVLVGLMCGVGGVLFYSGSAIAETIVDGGGRAVSARDVIEILTLLLTFLLSALTLAYSAGWLRQEVSDHRRRIGAVERECGLARSDSVQIAATAAAKAAEIAAQAAEQNAAAAASLAAIRAQLDLLLAGRITPSGRT